MPRNAVRLPTPLGAIVRMPTSAAVERHREPRVFLVHRSFGVQRMERRHPTFPS